MAGDSKDLVPVEEYAALQVNTDQLMETIQANIGGQQLSEFDLDRVKMPAGGGTAWSVPTLEGETPQKAIEGVIVFWKDTRSFWATKYEGGSEPPDCSSPDAKRATGDPKVATPKDSAGFLICDQCPNAQFGSAEGDSQAQACKLVRQLFVLTPEDLLPLVVSLPPTSVGTAQKFFLRLARAGVPYYSVVTNIALEKAQSGGGIAYSRATFALASRLEGEQAQRMAAYAESMRPAFERTRIADPAEAGIAE